MHVLEPSLLDRGWRHRPSPKSGALQKGGGGLGGHAARRLLPRAGAKIKLHAQGQQAAAKSVQGSVKRKARLLQMQSPFYVALPRSINVSAGQPVASRSRISPAWPRRRNS